MIAIRNVNPKLFLKFKAEAHKREQTIGEAMEEAMRIYMTKHPKKLKLSDMPTESWGRGTENTSMEVDEIIYGKDAR